MPQKLTGSGANCMIIRFQRKQYGEWEYGFYINESTVVDGHGNLPKMIWDIDRQPMLGCMTVPG